MDPQIDLINKKDIIYIADQIITNLLTFVFMENLEKNN